MDEGRTCSKCKKYKTADELYVKKDGTFNLQCKECYREWHRSRYTPKSGGDDTPRDCVVCGVSFTPKQRRVAIYCSAICHDRARSKLPAHRDKRLQREYGITYEEFEALLAAQDRKCAICGVENPGGRWGGMHVDHCHKTGRVRGLLCGQCNHAIGLLKDSPEIVRRAADYLEEKL